MHAGSLIAAMMVLWFSRYASGDADWISEHQGETEALIYERRQGDEKPSAAAFWLGRIW